VPFLTLKGNFVIRRGLQPDGDTVHFASSKRYSDPDDITNVPTDTTGATSKALRLQSIDAPEKSQPLGADSRNALLKFLGYDVEELGLSDTDFTADGSPVLVEGWLVTHGLDGNKRPLSYIFREDPGFTHGKRISAEDVLEVIKESANYRLVARGQVFPAFYENTDEGHAAVFQAAARKARDNALGVWDQDVTTTGFEPTPTALGSDGALIVPKFYRRVAKWNDATANADAFLAWLRNQDDGKKLVQGATPSPVPLHKLFEKISTSEVAVPYDVTRLWFSES
jgi:endonuclease YncB( thermonuclease family)